MDSKTYNKQIRSVTAFGTIDKDRNPLSVLIIGNGFDLDLGMHTSYRDFAFSKFWPWEDPHDNGIKYYLSNRRNIGSWFDLEKELADYAQYSIANKVSSEYDLESDVHALKELAQQLIKYLNKEQNESLITNNNEASGILNSFVKKENYFIHSFNYTDIVEISNKLGIHLNRHKVEYIHGTIANNDIILGTGDNTNLTEKYDFLYKTSNNNYSSNNLADSLANADEICIFGHSLGDNDFDYFKPFFQKISQNVGVNYNKITNERLKLTIYTKDEESEIAIKRQLRKLTDNHLQGIYANCDFKIEYTKP